MSCPRLNSKNYNLVLLTKTIMTYVLFPVLSFVATEGKNDNGLKLEKVGPTFSSFDDISTTLILGRSFLKHFIRYLPHSLSGTFFE